MKQRINYILQELSIFGIYCGVFFLCLLLVSSDFIQNIGLSLILGVFAKLLDSINRK
jgi:hypothetical protein